MTRLRRWNIPVSIPCEIRNHQTHVYWHGNYIAVWLLGSNWECIKPNNNSESSNALLSCESQYLFHSFTTADNFALPPHLSRYILSCSHYAEQWLRKVGPDSTTCRVWFRKRDGSKAVSEKLGYELDDRGSIRGRSRSFSSWLWGPPASFRWVRVTLTVHLHIIPRLRMHLFLSARHLYALCLGIGTTLHSQFNCASDTIFVYSASNVIDRKQRCVYHEVRRAELW
jgi:hypothetical protein